MTYYADLTAFEDSPGMPNGRNVGWLSAKHPLPRGPVPKAFAHELMRMAEKEVQYLTRGCHVCEFCQPPIDVIQIEPKYEDVWEMFRCGNGEIHVGGNDGIVYVAPQLIAHYVGEHQYRPPEEFIQAVLRHRHNRPIVIHKEEKADG